MQESGPRSRYGDAMSDPVPTFVADLRRRWKHGTGSRRALIQEALARRLSAPLPVVVGAVIDLHRAAGEEDARSARVARCLVREQGDRRARPGDEPGDVAGLVLRLRRCPGGLAVLDGDDPALARWRCGARARAARWIVTVVGAPAAPELLIVAGVARAESAAARDAPLPRTLGYLAAIAEAALLGGQELSTLHRELTALGGENAALTTLNRTHGQFLAMATHEFKTPLTSIAAYTDVLLEHLDDARFPHTIEFLQVIRDETDRLTRMTERMVDYSRSGYGTRLLDLQAVSALPLITQTLRSLRHRARQRRQTVTLDLPRDLPDIEADPDLVRQIVVNLLGNAIKYTPEAGSITVSAREDAATVRISVRDNGPGVAPEDLRRIFRQFYRSEGAAIRAEGSGLGLAIVKHIVDLHGGHVDVRSRVGAGSTFSVLLPKVLVHARTATLLGECPATDDSLRRVVQLGLRMVAELMGCKLAVLAVFNPQRTQLAVQGAVGLRTPPSAELVVPRDAVASLLASDAATPVALRDLSALLPAVGSPPGGFVGSAGLAVPLRLESEVAGLLLVGGALDHDAPPDDAGLLPDGGARDPAMPPADAAPLLVVLARTLAAALTAVTRSGIGQREITRLNEALRAVQLLRRSGVPTTTPLALRLLAGTARRLGLPPAEVVQLQYVGALHDVGMVRIDAEIVGKRGRLSVDERDLVCRHSVEAAELLTPLLPSASMREIVRLHHERIDGTGYPEGRQGEEIPLGARILLVIDAFFAMMAARPWREPQPLAAIVREIQEHAGTQFDPLVVRAFLAALRDEGFADPAEADAATAPSSRDGIAGPAETLT